LFYVILSFSGPLTKKKKKKEKRKRKRKKEEEEEEEEGKKRKEKLAVLITPVLHFLSTVISLKI
jgi:transcriptional regulator of NAD metabolism